MKVRRVSIFRADRAGRCRVLRRGIVAQAQFNTKNYTDRAVPAL